MIALSARTSTFLAEVYLPYFRLGSRGKSRLKSIYLTYDMRDAASDNPQLDTLYLTSPEATSRVGLSPTLSETTAMTRSRVPVGVAANGAAFLVSQRSLVIQMASFDGLLLRRGSTPSRRRY